MRRFFVDRWAWALMALFVVLAPQAARAQTLPPPLPTCSIADVQSAYASIRPYQNSMLAWATMQGNTFMVNNTPFIIQGVNYYPMHSPWRRFLTESDMSQVDAELDLIAGTGLNTIRIYLWNDALFKCPGSGAIPVPEAFNRLDQVVQMAASNGLRVIMTLNDMPDLETYPLYSSPSHIQSQTAFLVGRYRSEPAVMAWDIRNAGDLDYGSDNNMQGPFSRDEVLAWVQRTSALVKGLSPRQFVTAGWAFDVEATIPYVDFVSFAHWNESPAALHDRVVALDRLTDKPIVLSAFGFSTFERSEEEQAQVLTQTVEAADASNAAGWVVWTAFDFPLTATCVQPACPSEDNREHHFGLWRTDYTPKPALAAIVAG